MSIFEETWHVRPNNHAGDRRITGDIETETGESVSCATDNGSYPDEIGGRRSILAAAAPELFRALVAAEWEARDRDGERVCPVCDGYKPNEYGHTPSGHEADCILAAAIKKARGE